MEKLGVALSGGGFRSAFFHIGILARMAEQGLLKNVEVISTVSGGSIIGALYYLHVKKLLETRTDQEINDWDYLEIVQRMEHDFLDAVQKNIYMQTFRHPLKNMKMCFGYYSRSDLIGELYDKYFYQPVMGDGSGEMIQMRHLVIRPKGEGEEFDPKHDNGNRRHKVPILLINATTLNTGHIWRFEAGTMGSPPRMSSVEAELDKNSRLVRPLSYDMIVEHQQRIGLGHAVAASAGVPGIFPPLAISGLYTNNYYIELVDGGVHDNQGIQGLLDPQVGCTHFIVSDASGQLADLPEPSVNPLANLQRINGQMMDRIREEQIAHLYAVAPEKNIAFFHLRKGLPVKHIPYMTIHGVPSFETDTNEIECKAFANAKGDEITPEQFGVHQQVQEHLSQIRTHLDAFSDVEAYSLMLNGYLMSRDDLERIAKSKAFETISLPTHEWRFCTAGELMREPTEAYLHQLHVGSGLMFKSFHLDWMAKLFTAILIILLMMLGMFVIKPYFNITIKGSLSLEDVFYLLLTGVGISLLKVFIPPAFDLIRIAYNSVVTAIMFFVVGLFGAPVVMIDIYVYDAIFLRRGKLQQVRGKAKTTS